MKGRQVVLGRLWGAEAAALMVDGRLEDLLVDPGPLAPLAPGAILRGRVDRLVKGQGGLFLKLPDGSRGYLRETRGVSEGQPLVVQVAGVAEPGKAVPVTRRLLLRGRFAIATPDVPGVNVSRALRDEALRAELAGLGQAALAGAPEGMGLILRTAAGVAPPEKVAEEAAELVRLATALADDAAGPPELLLDAPGPWEAAWRDWAEPPPDDLMEGEDAFAEAGVDEAVAALLAPEIVLPGGASAAIEPTRALVAIDVNTGRDTTPAAALKANIALARDLPRQLRLRGLGGQVVIDFAPMPKRDRGTLDQVLKAAFRPDGAATTLAGWTAMGLYELSRKRERVPLARRAAAGEG